ncbi:hemolysin family protein [Macrococcus caseolyticus]|uniref:hemolysin family protein n=1 Tax=Macrococcoides caseolyticum TaxID=69966 RepID=UPI0011A7D047|nr:hemolysin family protein [Macrococcus caseolyticus]MDJ1088988.1 hemolysin family protein [Macrococcus caseolyticus]MDJ1090360.1 hemolysin family protein [Macrococcus caseolyticus]MDJ1153120.1 hemolysin family protein [Macrococcus caseolyticus]MDJ1155002.1 hemolysin family protein [Macrococcus caseolyticus]MEB8172244.1 hemolysin family protein [Macrococcus caseolyticus]
MDIQTISNLLLFALLIALTALFVGSEFSLVKVRTSRIDQLVSEGNSAAKIVQHMVHHLDYYLSACQLGITVTALGLGWIGESTFEALIHPVLHLFHIPTDLSKPITIFLSFFIVTFIHVVIGELAPKSLAIQYAERMTLAFARPLYFFGIVMKPLIFAMNGTARLILRIFGVQPADHEQAMSEEELKIIMTQSYQGGEINHTELAYMQNIFSFDERLAKDIMVPRTQMVSLTQPFNIDELLEVINEHQFTRYPITEDGDKDHIIGFINVKEFLTKYASGNPVRIKDHIHDLPLIHEVTRISDALIKMQRERVHMALVIDEYGGTAGIITMEDILEEIVGEIRDEFDEDEVNDIIKTGDNTYQINGRVLLDDITEKFGIEFEDSDDIDTIGGWIQAQNPDIEKDDYIDTKYDKWVVLESENHQIITVALHKDFNASRNNPDEEEEA